MTCAIQTFRQISSLDVLCSCLSTPLIDGEWGVLPLDFDQMLVQGKPTLGDEHCYHFLKNQNKMRGIDSDAHYPWTAKIRLKVQYEACESVDKINQILKNFREQGWSVKVLTSRGIDMKEATEKHLKDAKLNLSIDDVIFKVRLNGSDTLPQKDESLITWMETQPQWITCKNIRILFADDSEKYCREVARVADRVEKAIVTCFHYVGALPNPELSETQMKQLIVQLNAHRINRPIPYTCHASDLKDALENFNIKELSADALYTLVSRIAELDGLPFKKV